MSTKAISQEKSSGLADLDFDQRTRKRAEWEAFEFEIVAENQIRVVNASYGHEKDEHEYAVVVEQRDNGRITPIHCSCPAFQHQSGACKHQLAVAMRDVVLGAAVCYTADQTPEDPVVLADGGQVATTEDDTTDECGCDEEWCPGPDADELPCFECFRDK